MEVFGIGIDVAKVNNVNEIFFEDSSLKEVLSDKEYKLFFRLKSYKYTYVCIIWTVKEALLKALKIGLSSVVALRDISVLRKSGQYCIHVENSAKEYFAINNICQAEIEVQDLNKLIVSTVTLYNK